MQPNNLVLLRRKEIVGTVAWIAWTLAFLFIATPMESLGAGLGPVSFLAGWLSAAVWVALDEYDRLGRYTLWTVFSVIAGPLGFLLYYLTRPPASPVCSRCGFTMAGSTLACPACSYKTLLARARSAATEVYSNLTDSLVRSPLERSKETTKHMCYALAVTVVVSGLLHIGSGPLRPIAGLILAFSAAAYWVMVAWWVYLDSAWRRMEGAPWAVLTLLTNVVGLVTYLVIRYPDPRTCARCGASIPTGLKYCPFCGSEAEAMCPHCQAPVKPRWQFCPICAARLTPSETVNPDAEQPDTVLGVTISGSVIDADGGDPIANATVEIDSLDNSKSASTDSLGKFHIPGLDLRPRVFVASAEGFVSQRKAYSPGSEDAKYLRFALRKVAADHLSSRLP